MRKTSKLASDLRKDAKNNNIDREAFYWLQSMDTEEKSIYKCEYYNYLYNSPETEKVLFRINNRLYMKYPEIKKLNKKIFELKYEERILYQDEINNLLLDIEKYNKLPLYKKIINKLRFIYRNIGEWKIIIYINNIEYRVFFLGLKTNNFNSSYYQYLHEVKPDNYIIINGDSLGIHRGIIA